MAVVDPTTPTPGDRRRSLDRPPGERYAAPGSDEAPPPGRIGIPGPVAAVLTALAGTALTVLLGGVLSLSAGLLLVAGGTGWLVGRAVAASGPGSRPASRVTLAVGLAVASVVLGHLGLWLFARSEGGALGFADYVAQTWGPLAVVQYVVAVVAGWLASR
jgi:hypothetical protein